MKTKIKICGITSLFDARIATKAEADYLGFIFNFPKSPRCIAVATAKQIISTIKVEFPKVKFVGVFINQNASTIKKIVSEIGLDVVQLHGQEKPALCAELKKLVEVWKAFTVKTAADLKMVAKYRKVANKIMLDAGMGSGRQINYALLKRIGVDILAGGLNAANVKEAIARVQPKIVDFNSGVEISPGKKDANKIMAAINVVNEPKPMPLFFKTSFDANQQGYFDGFGASYAPEMLIPALAELAEAYEKIKTDAAFKAELMDLYKNYAGRPTPLYFAKNLTEQLGGAKIYLKNEGLNHTGSHKINHCLGQALLAKRLGKTRLIAETGAGQHGLATATVAAKFGFACTVYMGAVDVERQRANVFWMEQLGAKVVPVEYGTKRLKDAVMAALQDWTANTKDSYYLLGSALGPHPYPSLVRDFQSIIGLEVKEQLQAAEGRLPDYLIACVGGGSNAIGLFNAFLDEPKVKMIAVEAGGKNLDQIGQHAARLSGAAKVGVVEGYKSYFITNSDGQVQPTHSISAGLDYSGIGPEHAALFKAGRVQYHAAMDNEVMKAFKLLATTEGIFPALESAHAVAEAIKLAPTLPKDKIIVVNISGRGDKDLFIVAEELGDKNWKKFLRSKIK